MKHFPQLFRAKLSGEQFDQALSSPIRRHFLLKIPRLRTIITDDHHQSQFPFNLRFQTSRSFLRSCIGQPQNLRHVRQGTLVTDLQESCLELHRLLRAARDSTRRSKRQAVDGWSWKPIFKFRSSGQGSHDAAAGSIQLNSGSFITF